MPKVLATGRRWLLALLVLIGVGQATAAVGVALLVERAFTLFVTVGGSPLTRTGLLVGLGLIVGVVLSAMLRRWERVAAERLGQHYVVEVRDRLFRHLTRVPSRALGRRSRGNMLLKFVGDLNALRAWVSLGLARLLVAGVAVGLATLAIVVVDPVLGISLGVVLIAGGLSTWLVTPALMRTTREARRRRARLTGEVTERLSQVGVLQASGQERRERKRVLRHSGRVSAAMIARARVSGTTRALAEGTGVLATVVVLLVGAVQVSRGAVSAGTVVAVMSIAGLLAAYLRDLGRVAEYAAGAAVAREAVLGFMAMDPMPDSSRLPDLDATDGRIDLVGITVGDILHDITVSAEPGETIAVVGPNGAGKSTLVGVLARLFPPDAGTVLIDGQDVTDCNLASVRSEVGVASPDLPLLKGSVRRNVRYRRPKATRGEIGDVVRLCGLQPLLQSLPEGWDTGVGDAGSRLSAGQRARLLVARACLGDPAVLVLDEAEAHLDRDAAGIVERVLGSRSGTTIVVTHRPEIVRTVDTVWFLDAGRVLEVGPPAQLLDGDGPTARLLGVRDVPESPDVAGAPPAGVLAGGGAR